MTSSTECAGKEGGHPVSRMPARSVTQARRVQPSPGRPLSSPRRRHRKFAARADGSAAGKCRPARHRRRRTDRASRGRRRAGWRDRRPTSSANPAFTTRPPYSMSRRVRARLACRQSRLLAMAAALRRRARACAIRRNPAEQILSSWRRCWPSPSRLCTEHAKPPQGVKRARRGQHHPPHRKTWHHDPRNGRGCHHAHRRC